MKDKIRAWQQKRRQRRILRNVAKLSAAWSEYEDFMRSTGRASMLKVARRELIAGRFKMQDWLAS